MGFILRQALEMKPLFSYTITIPPAAPPYSDSNVADGDSDRNDSGAEDRNDFV